MMFSFSRWLNARIDARIAEAFYRSPTPLAYRADGPRTAQEGTTASQRSGDVPIGGPK